MVNLYYLCSILLFLPLIGSIVLCPLGKVLSNRSVSLISILFITISTLVAIYLLWRSCFQDFATTYIAWYKWGDFGKFQFKFGFLLDQLNIVMLAVTAVVSLIVQIYSVRYMQNDLGYARFFSYMCFFTFSMLLLIISDNLLQMFFGWELVGLSSYLLINYWFQQEPANLAAFKAFIVNRIGDCSFLLGMAAIFTCCGSLDYANIFQKLSDFSDPNLICGLLFFGAIAKSAQVPLHVWLPDAMEGPTPVSALIHSATMVTAGVFILARMSPIFEQSEYWLNIILFTGTVTTLLMSILAVIETDLKKIIAYSTISQLGIMMVAIGVSAYSAAIFHLINHAFFKALLFLAIGSIILLTGKNNNIYELPGGLKKDLPITFWTTLIATLSISGFPGFSGFFSKELIITALKLSYLPFADSAYYILLLAIFITAFYSFRMFFLVFYQQQKNTITTVAKESKTISCTILILAGFSIISGFLLFLPIISSKLFLNNIIVLLEHDVIKDFYDNDFVNTLQYFGHGFISNSGICTFLGIISATILYIKKPSLPNLILDKIKNNFLFFYKILQHQYFFNQFNKLLVMMFKFLCQIFYEVFDQMFIDRVLVNGTAKLIVRFSKTAQKLQTGDLHNYISFMLTGVLIVILWLFLITH